MRNMRAFGRTDLFLTWDGDGLAVLLSPVSKSETRGTRPVLGTEGLRDSGLKEDEVRAFPGLRIETWGTRSRARLRSAGEGSSFPPKQSLDGAPAELLFWVFRYGGRPGAPTHSGEIQ